MSCFFCDLEKFGVFVIVVIVGSVLGSGFEVVMVCYYCIVLDDFWVWVGMFEVNLGLMLSGGSVICMMWFLGIE